MLLPYQAHASLHRAMGVMRATVIWKQQLRIVKKR
jgi:hypothetical protein